MRHQEYGDTNCGAYAIAYLEHLRDGETGDITEERVNQIYTQIKFGDEFKGGELEGFSDPVKMIIFLRTNGANTTFYVGELSELMEEVREKRTDGIPKDITIKEAMPQEPLNEGEYFIAIVNSGTHYRLYYHKTRLLFIDPAYGVETEVDSLDEAEGGILVRF